MASSSRLPATLIPGDGIGPEITEAVVKILEAAGAPFDWDVHLGGVAAIEKHGEPLPEATLASIRKTGLALKGPLTTPIAGGFRSVNVALRSEFDLYANVRPGQTIVKGDRYEDVDLILVRENIEGFYVGLEHYVRVGNDPHGMAMATGINTREGSRRIVKYAFDMAARLGRKRVTVVHKANILKFLTGIFLETAREVAADYPGIEMDDRIVDACAMQLVLDPTQFDVIVTTNMFGDILSDLVAGLVGGLGLAPGANIGEKAAIFEAVHGSAPDIAGKGIANPTAMLLAGALMLDHVGETETATRIRKAVLKVLDSGVRTGDLGGKAKTSEFAAAMVSALG
jgi:isocitrate dehydrogenase (NAD+)